VRHVETVEHQLDDIAIIEQQIAVRYNQNMTVLRYDRYHTSVA